MSVDLGRISTDEMAQQRAESFDPTCLADMYLYLFAVIRASAPTIDNAVAEDVVMDTIERALRHPPALRNRGTPLLAWLRVVAPNVLIDHYRREQRRPRVGLDAVDGHRVVTDAGNDQHAVALDVGTALGSLPDDQRVLLVRCYYEGYGILESYGEGRPKVTASRRHREALDALRDLIIGNDPEASLGQRPDPPVRPTTNILCGQCGRRFDRTFSRGVVPIWCSDTCRRRAANRTGVRITGGGAPRPADERGHDILPSPLPIDTSTAADEIRRRAGFGEPQGLSDEFPTAALSTGGDGVA